VSLADPRSLRTVLVDAERRLAAAGVPSPRADAELLLAYVLGVPRTRLVLSEDIERPVLVRYESLLTRRAGRQPLQHLLGEAYFRDIALAVGRGVFVPRPETELVAEAAIRGLLASPSRLAVDLCAGSGAIGLSLAVEVPHTAVHLVESDPAAYEWLQRNAAALADRVAAAGSVVTLHLADATTVHDGALAEVVGLVDVVACNPPYVPDRAVPRDPEVRDYDPPVALYGGADGLDVVRGIEVAAAALLRPGGTLVVEHGDEQGDGAGELGVPYVVRESGQFVDVVDRGDLAGRDRFTVATRSD
jgi:release factor glutamine methyltransferase